MSNLPQEIFVNTDSEGEVTSFAAPHDWQTGRQGVYRYSLDEQQGTPSADQLLTAASHALRSYQYHNASTELAEGIADSIDEYLARDEVRPLPPMTAEQGRSALRDLELIVRGDEGEIPWDRLRVLLDQGLAMMCFPVIAQGSRTSVNVTHKGMQFMDLAVFEGTQSPKLG